MTIKKFTWTDDPADLCSLCVQWTEPVDSADDPYQDSAVPYMPSGPVDRVYRGIHAKCQANLELHNAEHRNEPGMR